MAKEDLQSGSSPELSSLLGEMLANEELMKKIGEIAGNAPKSDGGKAVPTSPDGLLSDPDIMSKLPAVMSMIKPLISQEPEKKGAQPDKRMALLLALKPYLSDRRCEAIDYFTKMNKLTETFKGLKL